MIEPRPLTRDEAARYLNISLSTFKRHVAPKVPPHRIGTKPLWLKEDLDAWLDTQKVGGSSGDEESRTSGSGTKVDATSTPRVRAIRERLERRRHGSTPRLSLVKG